MPSISDELTVRDLRRRWKPTKDRLNAEQDSHPTAIRVHRAFSWMARVEDLEDGADLDVALICRWVAFNALYGQWNEEKREPAPDCASWRGFLGRILELDATSQLGNALIKQRNLVMSILDDEYLSRFFWEEPSDVRARKSKKAKYDAQTWYLEKRWVMILDRLVALPGPTYNTSMFNCFSHFWMFFAMNSGPFSLRMSFGMPRIANSSASLSTTSSLVMLLSVFRRRHSRVNALAGRVLQAQTQCRLYIETEWRPVQLTTKCPAMVALRVRVLSVPPQQAQTLLATADGAQRVHGQLKARRILQDHYRSARPVR